MLSKYKTFFNVIFADGKLCTHDKTPGYGHTANFIFTDSTWYMLSTTSARRKSWYSCEYNQLDIAVAGIIKYLRTIESTSDDISSI